MSQNQPQYRKIQTLSGERAFLLCLPKEYMAELGLGKGDYVKCRVQDGELVVKKAEG
jgi:formylmethanofuran dehydrogenase subunit D